ADLQAATVFRPPSIGRPVLRAHIVRRVRVGIARDLAKDRSLYDKRDRDRTTVAERDRRQDLLAHAWRSPPAASIPHPPTAAPPPLRRTPSPPIKILPFQQRPLA